MAVFTHAHQAWEHLFRLDAGTSVAQTLEQASVFKQFAPQQQLMRQDEDESHLFLLGSGRAKAYRLTDEAQEVWLADFYGGALVGDMAALTGQRRSAFVEAVTAVTAWEISYVTFRQVLSANGELALRLVEIVNRRLYATSRQLAALQSSSVRNRIFLALADMGITSPEATNKLILPPPKVTDLARRVHTERETASRAISALEKKGILTRSSQEWTLKI